MSVRRSVLAVAAAGALLLGACGDDGEEAGGSASTGEVQSGEVSLQIADFAFTEEDVTVEAGTTVTWENADDAVHTATADDGSFDTGDIPGGESGEVTLDEPGTYSYHCEPHPFMKASITVE